MFDLFRQFFLHRGSIKSQYLPFYLKWVSECYRFLNVTPATRLNGKALYDLNQRTDLQSKERVDE